MPNVSGLNAHDVNIARDRGVQAALLMLHHAADVHYTQDSRRWEGIEHRLLARLGQFPQHSDCSSSSTWILGNALWPFKKPDIVNGTNWQGGFTGTLVQHGLRIPHPVNARRCDLAFYGSGPNYEHVAVVMTRHGTERPKVFSHGSEAGPFLLPFDYRPDFAMFRRYL